MTISIWCLRDATGIELELELDGVDTAIPNSQCNEHVVAPHGMFLALLPG